jgi:hypothetical protein
MLGSQHAPRDGKSHPRSRYSSAGFRPTIKTIEQVRQIGRRNPRPVIADSHGQSVGRDGDVHANRRTCACVLSRILQNVGKRRGGQSRVEADQMFGLRFHLNLVLPKRLFYLIAGSLKNLGRVHPANVCGDRSRIDARTRSLGTS